MSVFRQQLFQPQQLEAQVLTLRFLSHEVAAARSCGRKPAVCETNKFESREAATAIGLSGMPCRRFAAHDVFLPVFRGLTPTATCGHRFAIPETRKVKFFHRELD
jgi:hypothetical protein